MMMKSMMSDADPLGVCLETHSQATRKAPGPHGQLKNGVREGVGDYHCTRLPVIAWTVFSDGAKIESHHQP